MSEGSVESEVRPSASAVDVVEAIKSEPAIGIFQLNMSRITALLNASATGIDASKLKVEALRQKFLDATPDPEYEDRLPSIERLESGLNIVRLGAAELNMLRDVMNSYSNMIGELHYYLHNILCVAAWGAFEGYMQAVLAEVFTANVHLLPRDKKISIGEAIDAGESLVQLVVAREIDDIGRRSFNDLQAYIRANLRIQFSNDHANRMREVYFLRNVIAHSAGFLRAEQLALVPEGVEVENRELRIAREYLEGVIACIRDAVEQLDAQLRETYFGGRAQNLRGVASPTT